MRNSKGNSIASPIQAYLTAHGRAGVVATLVAFLTAGATEVATTTLSTDG